MWMSAPAGYNINCFQKKVFLLAFSKDMPGSINISPGDNHMTAIEGRDGKIVLLAEVEICQTKGFGFSRLSAAYHDRVTGNLALAFPDAIRSFSFSTI